MSGVEESAMRIARLVDHPGFRAPLAELHGAEWKRLYADWDEAVALAEFASESDGEGLPATLIALGEGNVLLGSVSLVYHDLPSRPDLNPWLASLYVLPGSRRLGAGGALVRAALAHLGALGVQTVFAFTETAAPFFHRFGFRTIDGAESNGHPITLLECRLPADIGDGGRRAQ